MKKKHPKIVYYRRRLAFVLVIVIFISFGYHLFHSEKQSKNSLQVVETFQEKWKQATGDTALKKWHLILVNESHPISDNQDIILEEVDYGEYVDERIAPFYRRMKKDAQKAGYHLATVSGYRSVDYQNGLFQTSIDNYLAEGDTLEEAERKTKKYVQIPGSSEHHTGLAIDIASEEFKNSGQELTDDLEKTDEYKWLLKNSPKYGFILRYPKKKEKVTKIGYEPWHFRYVGTKEAIFMTENNLTLEELYEKMGTKK